MHVYQVCARIDIVYLWQRRHFFTETRQQQEGVGIRGGFLCLKAQGKDCRGIKVGEIVLDESERHVGEGKRVRSLGMGALSYSVAIKPREGESKECYHSAQGQRRRRNFFSSGYSPHWN